MKAAVLVLIVAVPATAFTAAPLAAATRSTSLQAENAAQPHTREADSFRVERESAKRPKRNAGRGAGPAGRGAAPAGRGPRRNFDASGHDRGDAVGSGRGAARARREGGRADPVVQSQQVMVQQLKTMSQRGEWGKVLQALAQTTVPLNDFIYNTAVNAMGRNARWQEGKDLLSQMRAAGIEPDAKAYTAVINACGRSRKAAEAIALLREMQAEGLTADEWTYGAAIDACAKSGGVHFSTARELLQEMVEAKLEPTMPCWAAAITACARNSDADGALEVRQQTISCFCYCELCHSVCCSLLRESAFSIVS
jgi:pentatricopeptide repeat protein